MQNPAEIIEMIQFVTNEFLNSPIESGALKGELDPSLAIEKMLEISRILVESDFKRELSVGDTITFSMPDRSTRTGNFRGWIDNETAMLVVDGKNWLVKKADFI